MARNICEGLLRDENDSTVSLSSERQQTDVMAELVRSVESLDCQQHSQLDTSLHSTENNHSETFIIELINKTIFLLNVTPGLSSFC